MVRIKFVYLAFLVLAYVGSCTLGAVVHSKDNLPAAVTAPSRISENIVSLTASSNKPTARMEQEKNTAQLVGGIILLVIFVSAAFGSISYILTTIMLLIGCCFWDTEVVLASASAFMFILTVISIVISAVGIWGGARLIQVSGY